jgi:hypothetical protein
MGSGVGYSTGSGPRGQRAGARPVPQGVTPERYRMSFVVLSTPTAWNVLAAVENRATCGLSSMRAAGR